MKLNNQNKGTLFIVSAVLIYGLYAVFTRFLNNYFEVFTQNYLRSILIAVFFLGLFVFSKKSKFQRIRKQDIKWFLIWNLSGATTVVLGFIVFNNLPISTTYFLFYPTMIISGLIVGSILYKEKINWAKITSIILLLLGLLSIYTVQFDVSLIGYMIMALAMGVLIGIWNTTSKKISNKYSAAQMSFIGAVATASISILGATIFQEPMPLISGGGWIWIFAFTIAEILTVFFVILGFKNLEAQIASTIMPLEIVFAILFGAIIFQEYLSVSMIIGGLLILIGATLPSLWELRKRKFLRKD
jgi:drug/metabolite transporter (DMT)-like permease